MEAQLLENAVHHLLGASTRHPDQGEGVAAVGPHRGAIRVVVRGREEVRGVDAERGLSAGCPVVDLAQFVRGRRGGVPRSVPLSRSFNDRPGLPQPTS
jgi:hypothetical protein